MPLCRHNDLATRLMDCPSIRGAATCFANGRQMNVWQSRRDADESVITHSPVLGHCPLVGRFTDTSHIAPGKFGVGAKKKTATGIIGLA